MIIKIKHRYFVKTLCVQRCSSNVQLTGPNVARMIAQCVQLMFFVVGHQTVQNINSKFTRLRSSWLGTSHFRDKRSHRLSKDK